MANLATWTNVIEDIQSRFGDSSVETLTDIRRWLPQVLVNIWSTRRWKFAQKEGTITTVADTESYTLDTDVPFTGLYSVVNDTSTQIVRLVSDRTFDEIYPATATTGSPYLYRLWGAASQLPKLQLYPIPDGVYSLTYRYNRTTTVVDLETSSTQTTNDALTPDLPQNYRELLVLGVLARLEKKDENPNANVTQAAFDQLLNAMRKEYEATVGQFEVLRSEDEAFGNQIPVVQFPPNFGM